MRISDWSSDVCSADLPVTMTSNCFGARMSIIAAASTNRCVSSTSGYCVETHVTTSRHNCRSEEHTSELQSLMRISYAVFCLKKKKKKKKHMTMKRVKQ